MREAYIKARTLYEAAGNRLGKAHVLMGLGELERKLGRNNQAKKNFDQAAYMYEALGMEESKELAVKFSKDLGRSRQMNLGWFRFPMSPLMSKGKKITTVTA